MATTNPTGSSDNGKDETANDAAIALTLAQYQQKDVMEYNAMMGTHDTESDSGDDADSDYDPAAEQAQAPGSPVAKLRVAAHFSPPRAKPPARKMEVDDEEESDSDEESSDEDMEDVPPGPPAPDSPAAPAKKSKKKKSKKKKPKGLGKQRIYGAELHGGVEEKDLVKSYTRVAGEKKLKGKSNMCKHGSSFHRLTTADDDQKAETPVSILDELTYRLNGYFKGEDGKPREGPLYDPCPAAYNGDKSMRVAPKKDALTTDWGDYPGDVCYVNPPYRLIKKFLPKAIEQQARGITSVFLIPWRPAVQYLKRAHKSWRKANGLENGIDWVELIYGGVGFIGYGAKIPHAMCTLTLLGKGVKDHPCLHLTQPHPPSKGKKTRMHPPIHSYQGDESVTVKIDCMQAAIQEVPKPHTFDSAIQICVRNGIPMERIDIYVNSSKMEAGGSIGPEKIAAARKSWDHAYALLVPFYNFSRAYQIAMKETSILAYSTPILSNYAGETKCRFCSVLFVFCPTEGKKWDILRNDPSLHFFSQYANLNCYMPTHEQLLPHKKKKTQAAKGLQVKERKGAKGAKKRPTAKTPLSRKVAGGSSKAASGPSAFGKMMGSARKSKDKEMADAKPAATQAAGGQMPPPSGPKRVERPINEAPTPRFPVPRAAAAAAPAPALLPSGRRAKPTSSAPAEPVAKPVKKATKAPAGGKKEATAQQLAKARDYAMQVYCDKGQWPSVNTLRTKKAFSMTTQQAGQMLMDLPNYSKSNEGLAQLVGLLRVAQKAARGVKRKRAPSGPQNSEAPAKKAKTGAE